MGLPTASLFNAKSICHALWSSKIRWIEASGLTMPRQDEGHLDPFGSEALKNITDGITRVMAGDAQKMFHAFYRVVEGMGRTEVYKTKEKKE